MVSTYLFHSWERGHCVKGESSTRRRNLSDNLPAFDFSGSFLLLSLRFCMQCDFVIAINSSIPFVDGRIRWGQSNLLFGRVSTLSTLKSTT